MYKIISIPLVRPYITLVCFSYENNFNFHSVQPKESPLLQQLRADLKDKRMIFSKDQIHLSNVVGHGKQ